MSYLSFILSTIVFVIITVPISIIIFDFFGLEFIDYGNYLLWFIALALFNAILPVSKTSIFRT